MHQPDTILLGQYLKLIGQVESGGEAKLLIQGGQVQVNGQVETRRKRQLHVGDAVTWNRHTWIVQADQVGH